MAAIRLLFLLILCLPATLAEAASILSPSDADRHPLLQQGRPLIAARGGAKTTGPSLFAGRKGGSLFEPVRRQASLPLARSALPLGPLSSRAAMLRKIIARAEAGSAGYDAVQHGATRRPTQRPTDMTIAEIYHWIDRTPGQPHAIGRYQFIPSTLRMLVTRLGLPTATRFTAKVQDQLADLLLLDAGFDAFERGEIGRTTFMNNLAKIWAGLPTSSGRSHYHGYAGNKATMTWTRFEQEMALIFPG
ncbi:hypothetical protein GCM10011415_42560 [Salipiger pallidus]|uniref:Muramidase (Phage lambda lysozyme) n=1 Tax=Salipiger pallidus TaxID=1775170 RepID=A0A8J2ZNQ6_9RHOB|nr:hypothetical protein [Salipiger pallidus]GGG87479.1 hypothetical protein GCM10011415_42560 [Salipiger pallidus]